MAIERRESNNTTPIFDESYAVAMEVLDLASAGFIILAAETNPRDRRATGLRICSDENNVRIRVKPQGLDEIPLVFALLVEVRHHA